MSVNPSEGLVEGNTKDELPPQSETGIDRPNSSVDIPPVADTEAVAGVAEQVAHDKLVDQHGETTAGVADAVGAAAHVAHVLGVSAHDAGEGAVVGAVHGSGRSGDDGARIIAESARSLVGAAAREHEDIGDVIDGAIDGAVEVADDLGMDPQNAVAAAMAGALHGGLDADTATYEEVAETVKKRELDAEPRLPIVDPLTDQGAE